MHLYSTSPFVAGDRLTVADVAVFIYAYSAKWAGIDINRYPNVKVSLQWPGFQMGLQVPIPYQFSDEATSNPNDQDFYKMPRKFGGQAMIR